MNTFKMICFAICFAICLISCRPSAVIVRPPMVSMHIAPPIPTRVWIPSNYILRGRRYVYVPGYWAVNSYGNGNYYERRGRRWR